MGDKKTEWCNPKPKVLFLLAPASPSGSVAPINFRISITLNDGAFRYFH